MCHLTLKISNQLNVPETEAQRPIDVERSTWVEVTGARKVDVDRDEAAIRERLDLWPSRLTISRNQTRRRRIASKDKHGTSPELKFRLITLDYSTILFKIYQLLSLESNY